MPEKEFAPVQQRLMEFIRDEFRTGFNHSSVAKLIGDASSRQYFRYVTESEESCILATYPEPFRPESFSYKQIYDLFDKIGVPVPRIFRIDGDLGIVLQEDLGDQTLQHHFLTAEPDELTSRLKEAIGYVVQIQEDGTQGLSPECEGFRLAFDEEKLNWELWFFRCHYIEDYRGLKLEYEAELIEESERVSQELAAAPRVLCHRDYHIRNLMLKDDRLFVVDFQDARWGPASYDVASLLKDSIELSTELVQELVEYYLEARASSLDRTSFNREFHLMCIQRLLKALGTYGYQVAVRENLIYEQYMSGSLRRVLMSLQQVPEFPAIERFVESELAG